MHPLREAHSWNSPAARSLCKRCATDDPVAAIIDLAAELVAESELPRPGHNLRLLASLQDARIQECNMLDAGRLVPTADGFLIQVNEGHTEGRKHFTICHEIGHTLIPDYQLAPTTKTDGSTGDYGIDKEEEFLCDTAASELLMPRAQFLEAVSQRGVKIETIQLLAADFRASLEATALRLAGIGVCDLAVIVWELKWKPTQRKDLAIPALPFDAGEVPAIPKQLRIKFACCCGSMKKHFFPKDKSISEDSLVYQAYLTGQVTRGLGSLPLKSREQQFYMESQSFPYWTNEALERKVITLVFPASEV